MMICVQEGITPLMMAVAKKYEEIARLLVEKGASLNIQNNVCLC